jgi:predicted nucleotidyltransferase
MDMPDLLLEGVSAALAAVPGVVAVVLGGSRATGAAHASSDTDIGLYFSEHAGFDVDRLRDVVGGLVDEPAAAQVTEVAVGDPGSLAAAGSRSTA